MVQEETIEEGEMVIIGIALARALPPKKACTDLLESPAQCDATSAKHPAAPQAPTALLTRRLTSHRGPTENDRER